MSEVTRVQRVFDQFYREHLGPDREEWFPFGLFEFGVNLERGYGIVLTDIKDDPEWVLTTLQEELWGHSDDWTDEENQELVRLIDEVWTPIREKIQGHEWFHEWISETFWKYVWRMEDDIRDIVVETIDSILREESKEVTIPNP